MLWRSAKNQPGLINPGWFLLETGQDVKKPSAPENRWHQPGRYPSLKTLQRGPDFQFGLHFLDHFIGKVGGSCVSAEV